MLLEALYIPVERRVLRLVELSSTYARGDGEIPLTLEQLAELADTSRATVNKVLREEQVRGTVELRRGRTLVLDAGELSRRARGPLTNERGRRSRLPRNENALAALWPVGASEDRRE